MKAWRTKAPAPMVEKTAAGLRPAGAFDAEAIDAAPIGQVYDLVPRTPRRSDAQLRWYWAILGRVVKATDLWPTPEIAHDQLVKASGFVTWGLNPLTGEFEVVRDSFALNAMSAEDANLYVTKAMAMLSDLLGIDVADLLPRPEDRADG